MAKKEKNNGKKEQEICSLCGEGKKRKDGRLLCLNEECFAGMQNIKDLNFSHSPF